MLRSLYTKYFNFDGIQFTSVKVMGEKNIIFTMSETFKSIMLPVVECSKVGLQIPVKISLDK